MDLLPATPEFEDVALFGKSSQQRIVAVHPVPNRQGAESASVTVYYRTAEDEIVAKEEAVFPFFFLSDIELLQDFQRNRY